MITNSIICITGDCSDIQQDVASMVDEGYKIIDIQSQFVVNTSGYDRPKSIIWLQKEMRS